LPYAALRFSRRPCESSRPPPPKPMSQPRPLRRSKSSDRPPMYLRQDGARMRGRYGNE
jgi:hypothetical protein